MKCSNCGSEINNTSKFCEFCGSKIETPNVVEVQPPVTAEVTQPQQGSYNAYSSGVNTNSSYNQTVVQTNKSRNGFAIASLILSIVGLLCSTCCINICAILGLIFGILGLKSEQKGVAIAGIVISSISILITIISMIIGATLEFPLNPDDFEKYFPAEFYDV